MIRLAEKKDLPDVRALMIDEFAAAPTTSSDQLLLSRMQTGDLYVADVGGEIVGVVRIDRLWPEATPLMAWGYIVPKHRGQGLLRALLAAAEKALKEQGYRHVLYSTCEARPHMMVRFAENGLQAGGILTFPNGQVEHFFWKQL